jgi:hypothetical protein
VEKFTLTETARYSVFGMFFYGLLHNFLSMVVRHECQYITSFDQRILQKLTRPVIRNDPVNSVVVPHPTSCVTTLSPKCLGEVVHFHSIPTPAGLVRWR